MPAESPDDEDDDLASAWESALAGDSGAGRALNQDEINSLLGDVGGGGGADRFTGLERLIHSGLVSYERLPMLEVVLDRLVRILSTSLRRLTGENVEVSFEQIRSLRFGEYMNSLPLPSMLAVFKAQEWDNPGLLMVDGSAIYTLVDVMLGGRAAQPMRIEGRAYTSIERMLVERVSRIILADVSTAFDPVAQVTFELERLETNPNFAGISRKANACVAARMRMDINGRGGMVELLFTYAMLEPVREVLLQHFMGERFGRDSIWETHLASELLQTEVELEAVLHEQSMRLSELLALQAGQTVMLTGASAGAVELRCGGRRLFIAQVGRRAAALAARIETSLIAPSQEGAAEA